MAPLRTADGGTFRVWSVQRLAAAGALLAFSLCLGAAIATRSPTSAVAAIAVYGLFFLGLTLIAPTSAPTALLGLLPLVTVEVGLGHIDRTVSSDKVALAVVAGAWWLRRGPWAFAQLVRQRVVVRWLTALVVIVAAGALARGAGARHLLGLVEQGVILGIFLAALEAFADPSNRARALNALIWGAAGTAALATGQAAIYLVTGWTLPLFFKSGTIMDAFNVIRDMPSTIAHANSLGGYMALVLPVTAVQFADGAERPRLRLALFLALEAIAILLATSIGTNASLAATALVALMMIWHRLGRMLRVAVPACAVVGVAAAAYHLHHTPYSLTDRLAWYEFAGRLVLDHPILGLGAGGFRESFAATRPIEPYLPFQVAEHSSFVTVLIAWGIPGLVCFVGALWAVFRPAAPGTSPAAPAHIRSPALGLWLGLLAFTLNALSESLFSFSKLSALFWITAAMLLQYAAPCDRG